MDVVQVSKECLEDVLETVSQVRNISELENIRSGFVDSFGKDNPSCKDALTDAVKRIREMLGEGPEDE